MYPYDDIQETSLFVFPDSICADPSSTDQDFLPSSLLNIVFPPDLLGFNHEGMLFHDELHQGGSVQEMVIPEGVCGAKKRRLSSGGSSRLREQIRVNRRCKKDRHSKITTANGCSRGRRMRLSLNVAKEFFELQDMLGHDKASKTVKWLLEKSENAINEETQKRVFGMKGSPCPSTSVVSAIDELQPDASRKGKTRGGTHKLGASHASTRKLREKARERARKRTLQKKGLLLVSGFTDNYGSRVDNCPQGTNAGAAFPSLSCEKSAAAGNKFLNLSTSYAARGLEVEDIVNYSKQQPDSFEGGTNTELINDHSFFISNNWNPYTIFNLHNNSGTPL